jgi:hypothetical protein
VPRYRRPCYDGPTIAAAALAGLVLLGSAATSVWYATLETPRDPEAGATEPAPTLKAARNVGPKNGKPPAKTSESRPVPLGPKTFDDARAEAVGFARESGAEVPGKIEAALRLLSAATAALTAEVRDAILLLSDRKRPRE